MKVHSTSIIEDGVILGKNVQIGPFCIIHKNVILGDNTKIEAYSEIGVESRLAEKQLLTIGKDCLIRSHATIYIGSDIGDGLMTGHYVTIRENSLIGKGCQIGNRGDIQGDCEIGNYTKLHADVHVGKKTKIGNFVWLFPGVLITNDPIPPSDELVGAYIKDYAVLASEVLVMPGAVIGKDCFIGASAVVKGEILDGRIVSGNPGRDVAKITILKMPNDMKKQAYPWRRRFHRGYPVEIVKEWKEEFND